MKEFILIGAEYGEVNRRMQDYAFKLGYAWHGDSEYVNFDLDGYAEDGIEIVDTRVAIHCYEDGSMAYAEAGYYFEYCKDEYDNMVVVDYVELEKRKAKVMETE